MSRNDLWLYFIRTHSVIYEREGESHGCSLLLMRAIATLNESSVMVSKLTIVCTGLSKKQEEQLRLKNGRWYVKIYEHV